MSNISLLIFCSLLIMSQSYSLQDFKSCWRIYELLDDDGKFLKAVCVVGQKMTSYEAEAGCEANHMSLFNINNSSVETSLIKFFKQVFFKDAEYWIRMKSFQNILTCSVIKMGKRSNVKLEEQLCTTNNKNFMCELLDTSYKTSQCRDEQGEVINCSPPVCKVKKVFYNSSVVSKEICWVQLSENQDEALRTCNRLNMTLLKLETMPMKAAFEKYFLDLFKNKGALIWVEGVSKNGK